MTLAPFRDGLAPGAEAPAVHLAAHALAAPAVASARTYMADVSEFQPDVNDAKYLAWSKAMGIRAAFGDAHDDGAWYGGARRQALHDGGVRFLSIYHFLVAGQDGTAQANALHDLVGPLRKGEVLVADFEQGEKSMLTAWYNRMTALGYPRQHLWTYTGLWFGGQQGALPVEWIAAYQAAEPTSPHTLWQFSESFAVPGVGTADCSVFHGTIDELAALAYGGTPPVTAPGMAPVPGGLHSSVRASAYVLDCSWAAVKGATGYHYQLERYQDGFGWVLTANEMAAGVTHSEPVSHGTRYRWRVAAVAPGLGVTWAGWTAAAA